MTTAATPFAERAASAQSAALAQPSLSLQRIIDHATSYSLDLVSVIDLLIERGWTGSKAVTVAQQYRQFLAILLIAATTREKVMPIPPTEDIFAFWKAHCADRRVYYSHLVIEWGVTYISSPAFIIRRKRAVAVTEALWRRYFPDAPFPVEFTRRRSLFPNLMLGRAKS